MGKTKKSPEQPIETSPSLKSHPTRDELYAIGKSLRDKLPRESHAAWKPVAERPDPLVLMEESNKGRMPQLIPIRHGRMLRSPFTFYRGAALNMAADLAGTPASGIRVQACGDCHLANFGAFATPERRVIFDINDLDETLPAPWEWDVKRLAASFVLACRDNGIREDIGRDAVRNCVRSYREHMAEYSDMPVLDVWYASIDAEDLIPTIQDEDARKRVQKRLAKARERSVREHEFPELATTVGIAPMIKENPPLIFHWREKGHEEFTANVQRAFARYRDTLQEDRRLLLDRFKLQDVAVKVVGVGSVGTYCAILLLMASEHDPLFLQVKQARPSVLEAYAGKSVHTNHGERVVHGCRMMQSASDMFLGWTEGEAGRQFYVRQLKDMKIKPMVEVFTPAVLIQYADWCGWTLAHAHARSGEPVKISGYLGKSDKFDKAIADFSVAYADQSERDHDVLMKAVRAGKLEVFIENE
ncbi:hypothetical protein AYO40_03270 [Planctomycetaceae bacterium SCGC AG-212-D15]|nr:hypothetical protein AYO40_03270 [Planctomycetaceae bacterium SCGC AG-212-D15]